MATLEEETYLDELIKIVDERLRLVANAGTSLLSKMTKEFSFSAKEQQDVLEALFLIEKAYVHYGSAEYLEGYLIVKDFKFTEELPAPVAPAKADANAAMLVFIGKLRDMGCNNVDIDSITDDFKHYLMLLREFGSARTELDMNNDRNAREELKQ